MKYQFSKGYSSRGAQMGRPNCTADRLHTGKAYLQKVRFIDYAYDPGGAYWGCPANLYVCFFEGETEQNECFVRATSRAEAKKEAKKIFPNISFYN